MKTNRIDVVCAIIEYGDGPGRKVLAAQRGDGKFKGKWEFPGGKVEKDELPSEALKREIREELDCGVEILEVLPYHDYDCGRGKILRLMPFLCRAEGCPTPLEHSSLREVTLEETRTLDWTEADKPVLLDWQERVRLS